MSTFIKTRKKGIYRVQGEVSADQIMEMANKLVRYSLIKRTCLDSPQKVRDYLQFEMAKLEREEFRVIFLDNRHKVLAYETMFTGTIDGASVYCREVVKRVLFHNAKAVIFVHNHPSGCPTPSSSDRAITKRLVDALDLVDARVLDHFVVGFEDTESFAELGFL